MKQLVNRMLKISAGFILGSSKASTYLRGYALYLEHVSGYMAAHSINLDVIGRYASGQSRPYRSQVVTSTSMELVQLPGLRARILQGRAQRGT
jgi:hypothetical protein